MRIADPDLGLDQNRTTLCLDRITPPPLKQSGLYHYICESGAALTQNMARGWGGSGECQGGGNLMLA